MEELQKTSTRLALINNGGQGQLTTIGIIRLNLVQLQKSILMIQAIKFLSLCGSFYPFGSQTSMGLILLRTYLKYKKHI